MRHAAIIEKLSDSLGDRAASALADILEEMFEEIRNSVTKADFAELKGVVKELGDAQKRSEDSLDRLAQAQKRTEERVEELAQAQKRTEERVEELAQAQKRTEERVEELAQAQKRTEIAVQNLAKQVGGLSEALGGNLEDLACEVVPEVLENRLGLEILSVGPEELRLNGERYPFDLVVRARLENREVLYLGEVKSNITASEVRKFLALVNKVKQLEPALDIRPLFFGYRANGEARDEISAYRASMIFSRGIMI